MKKLLILAAIVLSSQSRAENVTCEGILIELDLVPQASFPMAVVYDNTNDPYYRTCVLDLGNARHWPLKGSCANGEICVIAGPFYKKIGNTYYMRQWSVIATPEKLRKTKD